ncbi:MAG: hypothetical protein AB1478_02930 [Nitrospirota bacterium]
MEPVKYLTDEEIIDVLKRIGIRRKAELDTAIAEYKKYWLTVYLASPKGSNKNRVLSF